MSANTNNRKINSRTRKKKKKTKIKKNRIIALFVLIGIAFFLGFGTRYMVSGGELRAEGEWVQSLKDLEAYEYRNTMVSVIDRENNILEYILVLNQSNAEQDVSEMDLNVLYIPAHTYFDTPGNDVETIIESYHEGEGYLVNIIEEYFEIPIHDYMQLSPSLFEHLAEQLEFESNVDLFAVTDKGDQLLEMKLDSAQPENDADGESTELLDLTNELKVQVSDTLHSAVQFREQVVNESGLLIRPAVQSFICNNMITNLNWDELEQLTTRLQPNLEATALNLHVLPGEVEQVNGQEYLLPDNEELESLVEQYFTGGVEYVDQEEITVEILDGCGDEQAVREVENILEDQDFQIVEIGEADNLEYSSTQVISRSEPIDAARQVALEITGADLLQGHEQNTEVLVTVIVGENFIRENNEQEHD